MDIWQDIIVDLTSYATDGVCSFKILERTTPIYSGKAYAGTSGNVKIKINEIIRDYLYRDDSNFSAAAWTTGETVQANTIKTFIVTAGSSNTQVGTYSVAADWSYGNRGVLGIDALKPINGRIDPRMPWTYSVYFDDGDTFTVNKCKTVSGSLVTDTVTFSAGETFMRNYDLIIKPSDINGYEYITCDGYRWDIVDPCNRFALYYVNPKSSISFLLMEGECDRKDTLTRHTHKQVYDNTYASARGKSEYAVEYSRTYTLRTGWLTDEQAERMRELIESPDVWLYDMQGLTAGNNGVPRNTMFPVVITDTSFSFRNYRGERKLIQYTITAEYAQDFIRM